MALQTLEAPRRPKLFSALIVTGLTLAYLGVRHSPVHHEVRHEFTTQRPGEPRRLWRSMRAVWTFQPATKDDFGGIEDLRSGPGRLYYVSADEAGCLEKSTGRTIWQHRLPPPQRPAAGLLSAWTWHLATDSRFIYASGCETNCGSSAAPCRVCALNARTGALVWQRYYTMNLLCAPCPADSLVLLTDVCGKVTAARQSDGSTLWQRSMAVTNFAGKNGRLQMTLQAAVGVGVAQIGGRLLGFRLSDGQQIWERHCKGESALQAEDHDSEGFALKDGIVYALLENCDMVAIQAATGRPVWTRQTGGSGTPSSPVWLQGDHVFTRPFSFAEAGGPLVALRRSDGATAWLAGKDPIPSDRERGGFWAQLRWGNRNSLFPGNNALFEVAACEPVLDGAQRKLRSVETLDTVIARNPATGREQWRWQPDKGTRIDNLIPDGDRLIVSDGRRLFAFEDGIPDPLPTEPSERQHLIHRVMRDTFEWRIDTPLARNRTDWTEAQITLLRLGHDSVSPLLDYVHRTVDKANAQMAVSGGSPAHDSTIESALDLLFDLDDPATPPILARELDRARDPGLQTSLAEALIRWDDARALWALFRYVKSGSEDRDARQDALYFVCRCVDAEVAAGHIVSPSRAEITSFLLAHLADPKAPDWLHSFARFGLLNDRGAAAYRAAFATFKQGHAACLIPRNPTLKAVAMLNGAAIDKGFPPEFHPESICRDEAGTWWAAFFCDYLGTSPLDLTSDLWIVQSRDKKHWIQPAFAFDLRRQCAADGSPDHVGLTSHQGRLCLNWTEEAWIPGTQRYREIRLHNEVTVTNLYRDSDHDGLTDRLETRIGTDPHNADTNGKGIPDNEDKNPTYRPHLLTEEEGIYQAVIEGLCRYGRWLSTTANYPRYWSDSMFPYGTGAKPLVLPAPPGSTGVEILEHPGPVLFVPYAAERFYAGSTGFQHPFIGLDGRWLGRQEMPWEIPTIPPTDPFAPQHVASEDHDSHRSFHDFFPYALSPDHKRARVGWEMNEAAEGSAGYDIEVHKIGGQWLPVEFRHVYGTSSFGSWHATVPVAR